MYVLRVSKLDLTPKGKKKMFVCPFPTDPKYWKIRVSFFFSFLILNFAFLNKNVKRKCQNTVNVPKRHLN